MINNLFRQIDRHSVITFDIFDTLLKRDVFSPKDVFTVVEREFSRRTGKEIGFKDARIDGEKRAREKSRFSEVTLDEIYQEIEIDISDKEVLRNLELEVEKDILHANPRIKLIYDYCRENRKEIFIISDMYLPKEYLETVLKKEGFLGYNKLYVSCESRKTKRSGELYKFFCEEEDIDPKTVLHIGDSRYADFIGPRKAGIKGFHIDRFVKETLYLQTPTEDSSFAEKALFAFINSRIGLLQSRGEQIGFEVLGPVIDAFCKWIHEEYQIQKTDKTRLWFAARDMSLFAQAYREIYGNNEEFQYIYISRRSLRPILTETTGDMTEAGNAYARGKYTIREIIRKMGHTEDDLDEHTEEELEEVCDIRRLGDSKTAKRLLNSRRIIEKESVLANPGIKYLESQGLFANDIVLADVGWHGTTQYILGKIQEAKTTERTISGLYLGSLDSTNEKLGDSFKSFVFDEEHESLFTFGILVFESLILAQHGSTIRYEEKDNEIVPILGEPDNLNQFLMDVQSGALRFVHDYNMSILSKIFMINAEVCTAPFCKMITEPKREELNAIGGLDYDDAGYAKMARPKALPYYILHPNKLHYELKHAPWRIGFLYNLFKIRLPYAKIYTVMRKKHGKMT